MKRLNILYTQLVMVYQHKQNKSREDAQTQAYIAIRNILGVILFFVIIFLIGVFEVFFNSISLTTSLRNLPRLYLYGIFAGLIFLYMYLAKLSLRPKLVVVDQVENQKNLKKFNGIYVKLIIGIALFAGLSFVLIRLLYLNFS